MPPSALTMTTPARKRKREDDPRPARSRKQSALNTDDSYKKDMYLVFVRNALKEKANGKTASFDELVSRFNADNVKESASEAKIWVSALTHVVSGLERVHAPLVHALIALPWTTMDDEFVRSYMSFTGMLVSARPEYLGPVLAQITQGFTYESIQSTSRSGSSSTSADPAAVIYDRLHALLHRLIALVPTLSSTLERLLVRNFPHKRQDKVSQVVYIKNVLRVSEYCNELSDRLVALVLDRAIQVDVEIQIDLEDLDEELPDSDLLADSEGIDEAEHESDDGESDQSDSDSDSNRPTSLNKVSEMVSKLDAILKLVFDHLNKTAVTLSSIPSSSSSASSDSETTNPPTPIGPPRHSHSEDSIRDMRRSQFLNLLAIFDRTILRTFKSRYTQFIVFWYSSIDPEFTDLFLGLLVSRALFELDQPAVTRSAASSYVASFVSRARFVDRESARRTVSLLCEYLESQLAYVDELVAERPGEKVSVAVSHFTVFYAVAQAMFLTFCFRWRDLMSDEEETEGAWEGLPTGASVLGNKWMKDLDVMPRVIGSALNPLKICSQDVVKQFAKISQSTGLVYCYGIMEQNKRAEWAAASLSAFAAKIGGGMPSPATPLKGASGLVIVPDNSSTEEDANAFFPFDPYKLPQSSSFIEPIYREWRMVALDNEDDESDDEDDDVELVNEDEEEEQQLGRSFNEMSISPIRKRLSAAAA